MFGFEALDEALDEEELDEGRDEEEPDEELDEEPDDEELDDEELDDEELDDEELELLLLHGVWTSSDACSHPIKNAMARKAVEKKTPLGRWRACDVGMDFL